MAYNLADAVRLAETTAVITANLSNQVLESLPRAKYATFDSDRPNGPSLCVEGTRTNILQDIVNWIADTDISQSRLLWLNGMAGTGKTTLAFTLSTILQTHGILGGQFCCSRVGEAALRNPAFVIPTIAYQLASFDEGFRERISATLQAEPNSPYESLKKQLDNLIVKPLSVVERDRNQVVVLVLDALDECGAQGASDILQLLQTAQSSFPPFLKIVITSRPERHINSILGTSGDIHTIALHEVDESIVQGDIHRYLHVRLHNLPLERGEDLPPDWVKDHEIEMLAEEAGNLFAHAAAFVHHVAKAVDLRTQLDSLLGAISSGCFDGGSNPFVDLDKMYREILGRLITPQNAAETIKIFRLVVGSLVLLRESMSVDALERLNCLNPGESSLILPSLQSVIVPAEPPQILSYSFADFLLDPVRCTNEQLWINSVIHEARLACCCMQTLLATFTDYDLQRLAAETLLDEIFPQEVQYACRHWASHLSAVPLPWDDRTEEILDSFVHGALAVWVEVMQRVGESNVALKSLEELNASPVRCPRVVFVTS